MATNRVVITGGSGFLGTSLARFLTRDGYAPIIVSRSKPTSLPDVQFHEWDGRSLGRWVDCLNDALAVVRSLD